MQKGETDSAKKLVKNVSNSKIRFDLGIQALPRGFRRKIFELLNLSLCTPVVLVVFFYIVDLLDFQDSDETAKVLPGRTTSDEVQVYDAEVDIDDTVEVGSVCEVFFRNLPNHFCDWNNFCMPFGRILMEPLQILCCP